MFDFEFPAKAASAVAAYIQQSADKSDPPREFDVYVVWFSKTLQNWKALVSTTLPDNRYYEVTYNGDKKEMYLDGYVKFVNMVLPDA